MSEDWPAPYAAEANSPEEIPAWASAGCFAVRPRPTYSDMCWQYHAVYFADGNYYGHTASRCADAPGGLAALFGLPGDRLFIFRPNMLYCPHSWRASDSPIEIDGDYTVPTDATLYAEAGSTAVLSNGASITLSANSQLIAEGTAENPIHIDGTGTIRAGSGQLDLAHVIFGESVTLQLDGTNEGTAHSFNTVTLGAPLAATGSNHIVGSLTLPGIDISGGALEVDEGTVLKMTNGAVIGVQAPGSFVCSGSTTTPVILQAATTNDTWSGVNIAPGGQLELHHAHFSDTDGSAVFANSPSGSPTPVIIESCTFDGSKTKVGGSVLHLMGSPTLEQIVTSSTISNVPAGYGLYLWGCFVSFDGVTVSGCDYANTYIKLVTGNFRNCTFSDKTTYHGMLLSGVGTTANFQCCNFDFICPSSSVYGASLFVVPNAAPTFGYEGASNGVSNTIQDASAALMKMYGVGPKPIIDNVLQGSGAGGRNDWYQGMATGKFIHWASAPAVPMTYSARNQYWNLDGDTDPTNEDFIPNSFAYYDYSSYVSSPWGLCGGAGQISIPGRNKSGVTLDEVDEYDSLFAVALRLEIDENFEDAQTLFHLIASNSSGSYLRWQAMAHIVSTERHLPDVAEELWFFELLDSLAFIDSSAYDSKVYSRRLLSSYYSDKGNYALAIDVLASLLQDSLTYDDSLLVADDLVSIQVLLPNGGGGLDESALERIPSSLQIQSVSQGLELDRQLLQSWASRSIESWHEARAVPDNFALYQNYPNPFNPLTEIRFDLPEAGRVKVQIFNTLGQSVTTLVDEPRVAGSYTLSWNASGVASGLYVYRMEANGFVDSKKMVLIR